MRCSVAWCWISAATALFVLAGCVHPDQAQRSFAAPTPQSTAPSIPPKYDRDAQFGAGWSLVRGSCDTREVKIEEQSGVEAVDTDGDGCQDDASLIDPYCGLIIVPHCPGRPVSGRQLQADHVFSEHAAWLAGAWKWTFAQRREFSQDRANLIITYGPQNAAKGDLGPESWRPPSRAEWCTYARVYRLTATRYLLAVSPAQDAALRDMESTCQATR